MPHQPPPVLEETQAISIFTPVNLILLALSLYLIYTRLRPSPSPSPPLPSSSSAIVFKTFTPKTLQPFNGTDNPKVYLAVNRKVFDVTAGKSFYGPGGPYSNFAGRDASRGLALNSFDEEVLTEVGAPIDTLAGLGEEERAALDGWAKHFEGKYLLVGRLVEEGSEEAKEAEKAEKEE
ncbi:cytochrome b5 [Choiromyces venosus 120613-1]|uniref:Cytochrome b5 n=1 Tax=Choiromyces venosus 120613-1 TaxID=1336337 RepID=A0A3N4J6T3_9PEZI|nr:cytochrome b5 [Choiromyces venosus 120613-1]